MLARYSMKRGVPRAELPEGVRQDTRKHTRHVLRPTQELVAAYLADPSDEAWQVFRAGYLAVVRQRFEEQPDPFDALAALARTEDVFLGCSCPTKKNPDVRRCHTTLGLGFMQERYPGLDVVFPSSED